jgi:hypothetical protein
VVPLEPEQTISRGRLILGLDETAEMSAQGAEQPMRLPRTNIRRRIDPRRPSLLSHEGRCKRSFPDLSETTLIGQLNSLLNRKKFPVNSRREFPRKLLIHRMN